MKKAGVRLGIKSNLSPSLPHRAILGSEGTNSATLAQAERQIKALEEENKKLKDDYSEMSTMYHQLVREASHEKYDERRVIALKSHIIQLERQLMTLADAQGGRAATIMEVENALAGIADCARAHIGEGGVGKSVGGVTIPRDELTGIIESAESARIKLYKNIENNNPEKMNRPLLMMDRFVKQSPWQPVTLMDVCSGKLEHLNLKHVSKLEGQLAQLYRQLMRVNRCLYNLQSKSEKTRAANREVPTALYDRLGTEVSSACSQLNTVTRDLLDLTLLIPAAPWPPLQKPRMQELSTDDVISALPSFPRSKAAEGRHLVEALLKCYNFNKHMNSLENQTLAEELKFHQCVYDLQQEYIQSLFTALRSGYSEFEESTNKLLCQPLSAILGNYSNLREEASEEALRDFLAVFKQHADQLEDAVKVLQPDENRRDEGGTAALSEFGNQFLESLNCIHVECQNKRDKLISDLDEIKDQRSKHAEEMKELFKHEPEKDASEEYAEIIKQTAKMDIKDSPSDKPTLKTGVKSKSNMQGTRRKGSLKENKQEQDSSLCSCGAEDGDNGNGKNENGKLTDVPTEGEQNGVNRRPTTLGDLSACPPVTSRFTPPTPKRISKGIPTPSPMNTSKSGIPTQRSRPSMIPSSTPTRGRTPPGGRLTPIAKLQLKPKSRTPDSSPNVNQPGSEPDDQ